MDVTASLLPAKGSCVNKIVVNSRNAFVHPNNGVVEIAEFILHGELSNVAVFEMTKTRKDS